MAVRDCTIRWCVGGLSFLICIKSGLQIHGSPLAALETKHDVSSIEIPECGCKKTG